MKRIISLLLSVTMIFGAMLALVSCGGGGDVPEGMQLVRGSDALGYYFYSPEGWVVANQGNIAATYASKIDTTSVTFAEGEKPTAEIADYFAAELEGLPEGFEPKVLKEPEACDFGKEGERADEAYKATYTFKFGEYEMCCMQIFITEGEQFYIFTYTASMVKRTEEETYYDSHLPYVDTIIQQFRFVDKTGEVADETVDYPLVDGYYLVSDRSLCYFDFYMPNGYTVDMSTATVSVSREDGTNVNVSEATYGGVDDDGYWKHRFEELELVADNVVAVGDKFPVSLDGNNVSAVGLEYTYTLYGKDYKVYQVLIVVNNWRGFVFTYTAEADKYEEHKAEALDMLKRLEF